MEILLFGHSNCASCQKLKEEFSKNKISFKYIDVEKMKKKL